MASAAAAAGAAASPPWRRLAAALGCVPVAITLSELVGSCMFVDGRSMQPTLNPQHDGCVEGAVGREGEGVVCLGTGGTPSLGFLAP